MKYSYPEIYGRLCSETAILSFFKSNGEIRIMLGTRNLSTVSLLYGFQGYKLGAHDKRCNINNGLVAVYDLEINDSRSFDINRLISINFYGEINTIEKLNELMNGYRNIKEEYIKSVSEQGEEND